MSETVISWQQFLDTARTGDVLLFASSGGLGEAVGDVTGGPYSHCGMVVRADPQASPWLWHESGKAIAEDPLEGTTHGGAQLNDLSVALPAILALHDHPYYRQLQFQRSDEFERRVDSMIKEAEGRPFPSLLGMAEHWIEGHFLGVSTPRTDMFCSQLVAFTYMGAGLLGLQHPPNWYSPFSFCAQGNQVELLQGATFVPEVPMQVPEAAPPSS